MRVSENVYHIDLSQTTIPERIDLLYVELQQHPTKATQIFFGHFCRYYEVYLQSSRFSEGNNVHWQREALRFGIEKAALEQLAPHTKAADLVQIIDLLDSYFPEELSCWYNYAMQPINRVDTRYQKLLVAARIHYEEFSRLRETNVSLVK